ncbi:MAG: hypothetical protein V2A64_03565 [Candidatus Omnitrophota bacterium]
MKNGISTHRVVTFLTREELEFLDKLEKDMMFSTGSHIPRSKIIEDLVNLLLQTQMNAIEIRSDGELKEKMKEAITKGILIAGE